MNNLNPQAADQLVFTAVNLANPHDRVQIVAKSELEAKVSFIDKLGYQIVAENKGFILVDADEPSIVEAKLKSTTLENAVDEVMATSRWSMGDPVELLGGSIGSGFGLEEQ